MRIIFEDVNPEEANAIFSRLANYSFEEMTDNDRLERIYKYVKQGHDLTDAKYMFQEELVDEGMEKIVKTSNDPEVKKMTRDEVREELGFKEKPETPQNELHLDGTPPEVKPKVTKREIANYASKLMRESGDKKQKLTEIIHSYGVKKLVDLPDNVLDEVYQKLQELAG